MIDICMALDQSVLFAHWCADYSKYRGFLAGGIQTDRPHSLFQPRPQGFSLKKMGGDEVVPFLDHVSAAKTFIAHRDNTASYAGYK